jgi:hypothetical protein
VKSDSTRLSQNNEKGTRKSFLMPLRMHCTILVALNLQTVVLNLQLVAAKLQTDKKGLVPPAGFEPAIFTLKG